MQVSRSGARTMNALLLTNDLLGGGRLIACLGQSGFHVERARSSPEALVLTDTYQFHVAVVDMRPDPSGYEAVCQLRLHGADVPVLFVSARTGPDACIQALSAGADDVLVAPYNEGEMVARLKALVRRGMGVAQPRLRAGALEIDLTAQEVRLQGAPVPLALTRKEYGLLEILALRMGAAVAKECILTQLYGNLDVPELKTVDVLVSRLRRKLAAVGAEAMVTTVWGHGYALRNEAQAARAEIVAA